MPDEPTSTLAPRRLSSHAVVLAAVLLLAAGLRLCRAGTTSLWLDDFHSWFHARSDGWTDTLESVRLDNHPPLYFLALRLCVLAFGDSPLALRVPALLFGIAAVAWTWRLGRFLSGVAPRLAAALLVACSSLHLDLSANVRMYSLLALAAVGWLDAALGVLEERRAPVGLALWTAAGMLAHYQFLHFLVLAGGTACVLGASRRYRAALPRLWLGLGIGVLVALPWYAWGFRYQLGTGLAPGGTRVTALAVAESYLHLVYLNAGLSGPVLRGIYVACGAAVLLGALLGAARLHRSALRGGRGSAAAWLLGVTAFGLPLWSGVAAWLVPRAGFEWRYLVGAVAPLALLAALETTARGAFGPLRRVVLGAALLAAAVLAGQNAADPGREDYRGAVRFVLDRAQAGDAVVAADWQPALFPHGIGWRYYAPRLADGPLPVQLDHDAGFALLPDAEPARHPRVFTLLRSLPDQAALLRQLRATFPHERTERFGRAVFVHVFTP